MSSHEENIEKVIRDFITEITRAVGMMYEEDEESQDKMPEPMVRVRESVGCAEDKSDVFTSFVNQYKLFPDAVRPLQASALMIAGSMSRSIITGYRGSGKTTLAAAMVVAFMNSIDNSRALLVEPTSRQSLYTWAKVRVMQESVELPYGRVGPQDWVDPRTNKVIASCWSPGRANFHQLMSEGLGLIVVDNAEVMMDEDLDNVIRVSLNSTKIVLIGDYPKRPGIYYDLVHDSGYARMSL